MRSTKIKTLCSSSLWTCLHHMVILRSQNKITDFFMILAWASPFKSHFGKRLLRKWSGNEKNSIQLILIQLCGIFQKCTNCLLELQMPFSQNSYTRYRVV